MFVKRQQDNTH